MPTWSGTLPSLLSGDIPTAAEWQELKNAVDALVGSATDFSTYFGANITGSVSNPTIGNSTVGATYKLAGKKLEVWFSIIIGSTFSAGSGTYTFPLPSGLVMVSHRRCTGSAYVLDTGTADRFGGTIIGRSTGTGVRMGFGTAFVSNTSPQTWATGDEIWGSYITEVS